MSEVTTKVSTVLWAGDEDDAPVPYMEGERVDVEIERTEPNEIAMHTFFDGKGSIASYYWTREQAIEMAFRLLDAARLR